MFGPSGFGRDAFFPLIYPYSIHDHVPVPGHHKTITLSKTGDVHVMEKTD